MKIENVDGKKWSQGFYVKEEKNKGGNWQKLNSMKK
jgi:hypothetical protein